LPDTNISKTIYTTAKFCCILEASATQQESNMSRKKTYFVEYQISQDDEIKQSALVTQQQAVELVLYCEGKGYAYVAMKNKEQK